MEKLKKKRGVVRSAITRLINEMTTVMNQLPAQQGELEDKITLLTLKEKSLRELDTLIADLVDENNIEEETETSLAYEDSISIARSRALRELQKLQPQNNETTSSASNTALRSEGQGMSGATVPNVKLPKLELPKFNGDLAEWQTFWDQFQSSIDQNPILSPVDKLKYLKVHLVGRAEAVIKGIPVTGDNYDTAIELLKKRFGQPSVIVNDHLTHLMNIKSVATSDAVDGLRRLYDDVVTRMRSLKSLGVDSESYGVLLHTVLQKSLPPELILRDNRSLIVERRPQSDDKTEFNKLLEFIDIEVETREKCPHLTPHTSQRPTPDSYRLERHTERRGSAAALTSATTPELRRCVFCSSKEHNLKNCMSPLTIKEKKNKLKVENRCFRCTKQFHRSRECRSAHKLSCAKCSGKHLTVMCDPAWAATRQPANTSSTPPQFIGISSSSTTAHNQVLLQTARIRASGQTETSLRALIDGGSQRTFIRRDTSERLGCRPVGEEELTIFAFGDSGRGTKRNCRRVELVLRSHHGPAEIVVEALEVPEICGEILTLTDGDIIRNLQRQGITLADLPVGDCQRERGVSLLIGADYYWRVTTGNVRRVNLSLTAVETIFGWSLQGPIKVNNTANVYLTTTVFKINVDENPIHVATELCAFWELESLGIKDSPPSKESNEPSTDLVTAFNSSVRMTEGRYETHLPWKTSELQLMNNKEVASTRLTALLKKLHRDDCLLTQYDTSIREYINNGFAERVPLGDVGEPIGMTYYMPHRAVIKEDRQTTKIRIVFDASSHAPACASLNDHLHTGPNLNPELLQVLLNFRVHNIALCADIEKAFLQVSLAPEDRDALRFLWFRDIPRGDISVNPPETWKMTKVPFGASCSPFLLAATIRHHLDSVKESYPKTSEIIAACLYADDLLTGTETNEQARALYEEAYTIMSGAGMRLCKWNTNDDDLQRFFTSNEANEGTPATGDNTKDVKILGLLWNRKDDRLAINMKNVLELMDKRKVTKRSLLQTSARIYDPLGVFAPVVVTVKLLFQRLWELALEWDERLPDDIADEWSDWCSQLPALQEVSIPRKYTNLSQRSDDTTVQLHLFGDASPKAYGAVAYLRTESERNVTIALLMSKSRVAPLKKLTLPRLELMGALIAARLHRYIMNTLNISIQAAYLWTDSNIAMHWIKGSTLRWKPFVANRVAEIQQLTDPVQWGHCPSSENPADVLTRGVAPPTLVASKLWWNGPDWLLNSQGEWPQQVARERQDKNDVHLHEQRERIPCVTLVVMEPLIAMQQYSNLNRLLRVTAWILRFVRNSQGKKKQGPLTATEMNNAEDVLVRQTQRQEFREELATIRNGRTCGTGTPLRSLGAYLDSNDILRVGGRLQKAQRRLEETHPIILPPTHLFTELLIRATHERLLHAGLQDTVAQLREKYWIIKARQATKRMLKRCVTCDRLHCKPASEPTAPLPGLRVNPADPFEVSGMDFAGPLFAKDCGVVKKCYILVITCAVTRAVHLELVSDLTTETFILAFTRFISRRGLCRVVLTDNAQTFHRADKELRELWDTVQCEQVSAVFASLRVQWKFNVERAAWWGGFWERMVRGAKHSSN